MPFWHPAASQCLRHDSTRQLKLAIDASIPEPALGTLEQLKDDRPSLHMIDLGGEVTNPR
jgi:hypothetical protein